MASASIILEETRKKNFVYVNMSAGGRLSSVGATLAGMAHKATVYYADASRYSENYEERHRHGLSICDKPNGIVLENFQISLPDEAGRVVLTNLWQKQGKALNTQEILDLLVSKDIPIFQDEKKAPKTKLREIQQKNRINLNKSVLNKLERSGYIAREKVGRFNKITLTESGEYIANIIGTVN